MRSTEPLDNIVAKKLSEMTERELIDVTSKLREGLTKPNVERELFTQALEGCLEEFWIRYEAATVAAMGMPFDDALAAARAFADLRTALARWRARRIVTFHEWIPKGCT